MKQQPTSIAEFFARKDSPAPKGLRRIFRPPRRVCTMQIRGLILTLRVSATGSCTIRLLTAELEPLYSLSLGTIPDAEAEREFQNLKYLVLRGEHG